MGGFSTHVSVISTAALANLIDIDESQAVREMGE
jgi:hypothetical protein